MTDAPRGGPDDARIAAEIGRALAQRGVGKSICPSEVARALAPDWRPLMDHVRRIAARMDDVRATQGTAEVDPVAARGPIRLRAR